MSWDPRNWGKKAVSGTGNALSWTNANLNPFNPAVTQRAGNYWGNVISNNPMANRLVMGAMPVLDPLARGTYNLSGVANYQEAARRAERGDLKGALGQTALGAITTLGTAASAGSAAGAVRGVGMGLKTGANPVSSALAGIRGTRLVPKGSLSSPGALRAGIQQPVTTGLQGAGKFRTYVGTPAGVLVSGAALTGALGAGGAAATPVSATGQPQMGQSAEDRRFARIAANLPTAKTGTGAGATGTGTGGGKGKGGKGKGKGKGADAAAATAAAVAGTGTGADTAGSVVDTQLEALTPEEYEDLMRAAREAERGYAETINRIGRDTATEERSLYDYIRGVGRGVAGGRQDVSSALAQMGLDTSPAAGAYADYLAAAGQGRVAARRGQSAGLLQGLVEDRRRAEALKTQQLADLERQRINRQARASVGRAANFVS